MKEYEVIIIGGGPAGLSAALYTSRAQRKTLVLDKPNQGAIKKVEVLDNYLGFPEGLSGREFLELARRHVERFGAEIVEEEALVVKPDLEGSGYIVETAENSYRSKGLIIATGVKNDRPRIKNIGRFEGLGVSYCVTCDGFFFRDSKVAVLGSKDYAAKEALELLNYTKHVVILTNGRPVEIRSSLKQKLEENNIKVVVDEIEKIVGDKAVEGVKFKNGRHMELKGIFVAVGTSGATDFARTLGIQVEGDIIKVDASNSTGIPMVYAAGDCTGGNRQVAIAVGEGANAGINLISELKGTKYVDYH
ncbi:NAD(P)/FAD-dependent oxidoreductase [Candidatus Pyrohabitans sp.]